MIPELTKQAEIPFGAPLVGEIKRQKETGKRMRAWEAERDRLLRSLGGRATLTGADLADFQEACVDILRLMADGAWHDELEMMRVTGHRQALRRMRQLRKPLSKLGYSINGKRQDQPGRIWFYRIEKIQTDIDYDN